MLPELQSFGARVLFISADPTKKSLEFRRSLGLSFPLVCDEAHVSADYYDIPISHADPRAWFYPNGFIQPAIFAFQGERELFRWIQKPKMWNLWGASRRPEPERVVAKLRKLILAP